MASNTEILWTDPEPVTDTEPVTGAVTGARDHEVHPASPPSRPRSRLLSRGRSTLPWAALAAAAVATAALAVSVVTGDDGDAAKAANRAAWQHEEAQYVERLESRAASAPAASRATFAREAEQYVERLESRAASISAGGSPTGGLVPGSLHMPMQ